MAYIGVSPSNGVRRVHTYTATASQTTFSGAGAEGTSLSYKDSNFVDVYQNGIKLGDADYTSTSGTSIVLAQGASVDDLVVVVVFDVFSVADTVSKADGGTFDGIISTSSAGTNNLRIGANAGDAIASGGNYNVVLGDEAGTAITTGDNNVAVGYNALASNTTASTNTAVGYQAAYSNQTGVGITAFGANALYSTTASDNCGIGTDNPGNYAAALENNTTGRFNTAVATGALGSNTEGNYNTAVGHSAGGSVTTGDNNVAVGFEALTTEDTGQNNVAIGYRAMKVANYDGSGNNVAVGADAGLSMTTGIFNTFVGAFAGDAHTAGYNNVAIGTNALGADVSSRGTVAIGAAALSNQNNTNTDAFNTAVGFGAGSEITTGGANTLLGRFNGNQENLDIRTTSNNIVISDGAGNPKMFHTTAYGTNGTFYISNQTNSSYWPKVATSTSQNAVTFDGGAGQVAMTSDGTPMWINRNNADGDLIKFYAQGNNEGNISVSGTTVTYGGGHLGRWSQLSDSSKDTQIVKGTVMTNLDQMCVWKHEAIKVGDNEYNENGELIGKATEAKDAYTEDNEQLNCMAVSNVEGDANVAGVFVKWDNDDDGFNDMMVAMTGDMVIRIAKDTTVARGDLLMSAGDGTAKPQGDDIVRSKTIAKVTSTNVSHTYDDGSYLVPCVLMAC